MTISSASPTPKPAFCFADKYSPREILADGAKATAFQDEFLKAEADYFDVVHDKRTGLCYDGVDLDPQTGEAGKIRNWSAPSKECMDLAILVKALEGDPKAVQVVGRGDAAAARSKAVQLLSSKLKAYDEFQSQNPGYAGFLPWYYINSDKTVPTPDWQGKIPGLDNGEWMWTMLVAEKALRDQGCPELAAGYQRYNQVLQDNVAKVFYDPQGVACRGDVRMTKPGDPDTGYEPLNPGSYMTGEHGVHEGSMLIHYLTLFGKGLPEGAADHIWDNIKMERVESEYGTTWQGFWGSAHESWAYLFMPMRDHSGYENLFRIREEIRSQNAVDREYSGFATSTNGPRGGYLSAAGIEGIGSQPVTANDTFAVYGVFPMLLQFSEAKPSEYATAQAQDVLKLTQQVGPGNFALAWLDNMLQAPRMQGPLGAGESGTNDGQAFAAMKTTDGTHPMLLGIMGGLEQETASMMKEKGVYQAFMKRIDGEYQETFGSAPLREPFPFVLPNYTVPNAPLGDYKAPLGDDKVPDSLYIVNDIQLRDFNINSGNSK